MGAEFSAMLGLQKLYVGFLETRATVKHKIVAPIYTAFSAENQQIPELNDFMRGAKQAFIHVNTNLVSKSASEMNDLQKCFTNPFWEEIKSLGAHFSQEREKHGDDYQLQFERVEPYLNEVIYNEDEKKLFVEVEYFSRYRFKFEREENSEQMRFNTVTFEMEVDDAYPDFKISKSS